MFGFDDVNLLQLPGKVCRAEAKLGLISDTVLYLLESSHEKHLYNVELSSHARARAELAGAWGISTRLRWHFVCVT